MSFVRHNSFLLQEKPKKCVFTIINSIVNGAKMNSAMYSRITFKRKKSSRRQ